MAQKYDTTTTVVGVSGGLSTIAVALGWITPAIGNALLGAVVTILGIFTNKGTKTTEY